MMLPLRETFDTAAALYHRARPGYPVELFDDLTELANLRPGSRILEIGPGTGKATEPLAQRGYSIHAIELGPALAARACQNLAPYPDVRIDVGAFERADVSPGSYDLALCATSFHWIEQPVGFQRIAMALRPEGYFAEFRHYHVWSPESERFFNLTQDVYQKYGPDADSDVKLPLPDEVETLEDQIASSGLFRPAEVRRYMQHVEHTPESYTDLLLTFSGHIAHPEPDRSNLLKGIADVIRSLPGGKAIKSHLVILHVAQLK